MRLTEALLIILEQMQCNISYSEEILLSFGMKPTQEALKAHKIAYKHLATTIRLMNFVPMDNEEIKSIIEQLETL